MTTDPRQVRIALQAAETQLQSLVEPTQTQLRATARVIDETNGLLAALLATLRQEHAAVQAAIAACEEQPPGDKRPNCASLYQDLSQVEHKLDQLRRFKKDFEQIATQYGNDASVLHGAIQQDVPAACRWLRERDQALSRFDRTDGGIATTPPTGSTGGTESEGLTTLGKAGLATAVPALLNTFMAMLERMGHHGYTYQKHQQQYLRSLVDDPNQPGYVRGWVRQELNRIDQVQKAKAAGCQPPGRTSKRIKGIPGLDVGHRFPGLDLIENFRLEEASMNRRRYFVAKRLGISDKYR